MPITQTMLAVAGDHPQRPAIVGDDGSLDYAHLVAESRRVFAVVDAAHRERPVPPAPETHGIPITAVSLGSAFHTARIVASLAGYRAISATIDPLWPLAHRVRVIRTTGIGLIISDSADLAAALAEDGWPGTILTLDEFRSLEAAAESASAPSVRDDDEAFLLLFSSGTTSDPKAFLKTRRQYRANVAVSSAHLEPLPGVATLAPGPVSYSLTLYAVIECLATGGSVHLADVFDPARISTRISAERITRVVAVPAVVRMLTDAARHDPSRFAGLDLVVTGGANLPAALRDALATVLPHVRLISYYGAAEIGFIGDSRDGDGTLISVYDGIGARIRDDAGAAVPDGEIGTLWIRADACSAGYLAATSAAVLKDAEGWATVHDQARLVDGRLQLAGRAGDIVVTGGHKVALLEVEQAFERMPGLGAVCAVALPDPTLGTVVALVLETGVSTSAAPSASTSHPAVNPASTPDPSGRRSHVREDDSAQTLLPSASSPPERAAFPDKHALQVWAREHLAPQFVPRRWYLTERLPRTVGGKIRRAEAAAQTAGMVRL